MSYTITYKHSVVEDDIPALDVAMAKRIEAVIRNKLGSDPIRFGKPLQYDWAGARSLRVGDYRVIYDLNIRTKTVLVLAIGHRRDIYD